MQSAPEWILDRERAYKRSRRRWAWAHALELVGLGAYLLFGLHSENALRFAVGTSGIVLSVLMLPLRPDRRLHRYELAVATLHAGITRFETALEPTESMLTVADQRAREALRIDRKRTAPTWIRDEIRRRRLVKLGWMTPLVLATTVPLALVFMRSNGIHAWHVVGYVIVWISLLVLALLGSRKAAKAGWILESAVEQYEFESDANEATLLTANEKAIAVLSA